MSKDTQAAGAQRAAARTGADHTLRPVTDPDTRRRLVRYYRLNLDPDAPIDIVAGIDAVGDGGVVPQEVLAKTADRQNYFWLVCNGRVIGEPKWWLADADCCPLETATQRVRKLYDPAEFMGDAAAASGAIEQVRTLAAAIIRDFDGDSHSPFRAISCNPNEPGNTTIIAAQFGIGYSAERAGRFQPQMTRLAALIEQAMAPALPAEESLANVAITGSGTVTFEFAAPGKARHYRRRFIFQLDPETAPQPTAAIEPAP